MGMGGNGGSILINIQAKITGYQQQIEDIKKQLSQVSANSKIGQDLTKQLKQVEGQVDSLGKQMERRVGSESSLNSLMDKLDNVERGFYNIGQTMSQVQWDDLNVDNLRTSIQEANKELSETKQLLSDTTFSGLQDAAEKSTELKEAFKELKIDPEKMGIEQIQEKLNGALTDAIQKAEKAQTAYNDMATAAKDAADRVAQLNQQKSALDSSGFSNKRQTEATLKQGDLSTQAIISSRLNSEGIKSFVERTKKYLKEAEGLSEKTVTTINDKLKQLGSADTISGVRSIVRELNDIFKTNKLGSVANVMGDRENFKQYSQIEKFLTTPKEADKQIKATREQLNNYFDVNKNFGLTEEQKTDYIDRILNVDASKQQIEQAKQELGAKIAEYRKSLQEQLSDANATNKSAAGKADAALTALNNANTRRDTLQGAKTALDTKVEELAKVNAELQTKIANLEERVRSLTEQKMTRDSTTKNTVQEKGDETTEKAIENQKALNAEQLKYSQQLEKVTAQQRALDNLKMFVQRWFSVYAAVRMVRQAFNSIKTTIKDLDKTMTEIAIVTDKTQADLWNQMSSYTAMAKEYAVSISGVYKVSQLFYQQGLQQAEVMQLTEQTLKMAKISGLEYATATDYMTNAIRSFKMEMSEAQRVVDVYSAVSASSATNTAELATAMSKTASSAQAVGSSFENTTAMMAVMIESTRESAQNIGSAMKSIISRYGEMTSDPSKLVDSEGEEMSLNRVDKALQTVGISIHDASGQFRDFDDVIIELAANWDKIDKNTQRYIATIMAGNRQQSRFLALVSNYDRLIELSETAANSEDAATLQVLKTMDSIEAKSQQLQTSLQSLYTQSGIEGLYKGILDGLKNIIDTFNGMPKLFGKIPVLAITLFANMFVTIGGLVRRGLAKVTNHFTTIRSNLENKISDGANAGEQQAERALDRLVAKSATVGQQMGQNIANGLAGKTSGFSGTFNLKAPLVINSNMSEEEQSAYKAYNAQLPNASEQSLRAYRLYYQSKGWNPVEGENAPESSDQPAPSDQSLSRWASLKQHSQGIGTAMTAASMGLQLFTATMDKSSRSGQLWAGSLQLVSAALTGVGMALSGNPILGIVMGITTAISAIDMLVETEEEKVERLENKAKESSNKTLQSKNELKTLDNYKTKLEELYKTRNKDSESYQAWIDLNNEIAAEYPELISYIDQEGNSIVALAGAYDQLRQKKLDAYAADFEQSSKDAVEKAYNKASAIKENNGDVVSEIIQDSGRYGLHAQAILEDMASMYSRGETKGVGSRAAQYKGTGMEGLFSTWFGGELDDKGFGVQDLAYHEIGPAIVELVSIAARDNLGWETTNQQIQKLFDDYGKERFGLDEDQIEAYKNLFVLTEQAYQDMRTIQTSSAYVGGYGKRVSEQQVKQAVPIELDVLGLESESQLMTDMITNSALELWKKYEEEIEKGSMSATDAWAAFLQELTSTDEENSLTAYFNAANEAYSRLDSRFQKKADNLYNLLDSTTLFKDENGNYSGSLIKQLESFGLDINDDEDAKLIELYTSKWEESFATRRDQVIKYIDGFDPSSDLSGTAEEIINNIAPEFWDAVSASFEQAYSNIDINPAQATAQVGALTQVWESISNIEDEATKSKVLGYAKNADFSSLTGIYSFIEDLQNDSTLNLDSTSIITDLQNLSDTLQVNLNTEFENFTQSIVKKSEDFTKALSSASKGMDLSAAMEMANKMGLTLADFTFRNGKFFFEDAQKIQEAYIAQNEQLREALEQEVDAVKGAFSVESSNKFIDGNLMDWVSTNAKAWETGTLSVEQRINQLKLVGATEEQAKLMVQYYDQYYQEWKDLDDASVSFSQYVIDQINQSMDNLDAATEQWLTYTTNASLLQNGQIDAFLNNVGIGAQKGQIRADAIAAIQSGDIDQIVQYDELIPYVSEIMQGPGKILSSTFETALNSAEQGAQWIEATEANTDILRSMADAGFGTLKIKVEDGKEVVVGYVAEITRDNVDAAIAWAEENITDAAERTKNLSTLRSFKFGDRISALQGVISKTVNYAAMEAFYNAYKQEEEDIYQFAERMGFTYTESTNSFDATEESFEQLQVKLLELKTNIFEDGIVTDSELQALNEIEAKIAEQNATPARNQSSAVKELVSKRNELTGDILKNFGDAFGLTIEQMEKLGLVKYNENTGYYEAHLSELEHAMEFGREEVTDAATNAAEESMQSVFDDAISLLSNIGSIQSSGTTDFTDMQAKVDEINNILSGEDKSISDIFVWDDTLQAYTYSITGLQTLAEAARVAAINAGVAEDHVGEIVNRTLAADVLGSFSVSDWLTAAKSSDGSETRSKIESAIESFNASATEAIELTDDFWGNIAAGGETAIEAMKEIYAREGKTLSDDEIKSLYRAEADNLVAAQEQLSSSVGSIVDSTTADILKQSGYGISQIEGTNQYVITSVGRLISAYRDVYYRLRNSSEATIKEINAAGAAALTARDNHNGTVDAIDALKNAFGMSYEALGEIFTKQGKDMYASIAGLSAEQLKTQYGLEKTGAGTVNITDFGAFAKSMGWAPDSEEYISAFKTYNDSLIEYNNRVSAAIKSEVAGLKDLSVGGQLNVTYLANQLGENELNKVLENYGITVTNGILEITNIAKYNIIGAQQAISQELKNIDGGTGKYQETIQELYNSISSMITSAASDLSSYSQKMVITGNTAQLLAQQNARWKNQLQQNGYIAINSIEEYQFAVEDVYRITKDAYDNGTATLSTLNAAYAAEINANLALRTNKMSLLSSASGFDLSALQSFFDTVGLEMSEYINSYGEIIKGQNVGIESLGNGKYRISDWEQFKKSFAGAVDEYSAEYIDAYISYLEGAQDSQINSKEALMTSLIPSLQNLSYAQIGQIAKTFNMTVDQVMALLEQNADGSFNGNALLNELDFDKNNVEFQKALASQYKTITSNMTSAMIDFIQNAEDLSPDYTSLGNAVSEFKKAMKALGIDVQVDFTYLTAALMQGGEAAVTAAQEIAKMSGQELSAQDIASLYRGQVTKWINTIDTVMAKPGEIVDKATAWIIETSGGKVTQLGSTGQYVVESAANLVEAYRTILINLKTTGEATLKEINAVAGAMLDNRDGEQQAIDALGDAAGMTYTRFGEILADAGIELTEEMVNMLETAGVTKSLGGNKMAIVDFAAFADLMGWDPSSPEYVSAFKTFNDSLIQMNRQAERNILEEAQSVAGAKGGDWVNLTQFMDTMYSSIIPEWYNGNVSNLQNREIVEAGDGYYETILGMSFTDADFAKVKGTTPEVGFTLASITEAGQELTTEVVNGYAQQLIEMAQKKKAEGDDRKLSEIIKELDAAQRNLLLDVFDTQGMADAYGELDRRASELHDRQAAWYNLIHDLPELGGHIEDGILKLDENANIPAIMQLIKQAAEDSGAMLSGELAQLADTVAEALKSYVDLIKNGISGSLSHVQADNLQDWAKSLGIPQLDFTETTNGLKLANHSAIELYQALKGVDDISAQLVFDDLYTSLTKSGEGLSNISKTTAEIAKIQRQIEQNEKEIQLARHYGATGDEAKVKSLQAQNAQLREQLSLFQQIQSRQADDASSYDFMGRDLPSYLKGPQNYWNSVGTAFKTMNQSATSGKMAINDFYNIVSEMQNLAAISGTELEFMGMKIDSSAESAAQLINMGLSSLTNIDGEGVKIDLSKFGADLSSGADSMSKGFHEGIKTMAQSQIDMLDAAIQMLEVVVAMEDLGDIDVNSNSKLDLGEIFNLEGDPGEFTEGYKKWADAIWEVTHDPKAENYNEDLDKALKNITFNGTSMKDMIYAASSNIDDQAKAWEDLNMSEQDYAAVIDAFYQAALNGDYDLEHVQQSTWEILERTLPDGATIDTGNRTIVFTGGTHIDVNWTDPDVQSAVSKIQQNLKKDETDARKELTKYYTKWQTGDLTDPVEILYVLEAEGQIVVEYNDGGDPATVTVDGKTYDYGTKDADRAIIEASAKSRGIDLKGYEIDDFDNDGEIEGKTSVKYGNTEIQVKIDKDGRVTYVTNDGREYSSIEELTKAEYTDFLEKQLLSHNIEGQNLPDYETWLYQKYHVNLKTDSTFTDDEGNEINTNDRGVRAALRKRLSEGFSGEGKEPIKLDGFDDKYTVEVPGLGNVEFTAKNEEEARTIAAQKIEELLGVDSALVDNISSGITQAFTENSGAIAEAFATALTTALTTGATGEGGSIPLDNITISATSITFDTSNMPQPQTEGEVTTEVPISSVILKPSELKIDTTATSGTISDLTIGTVESSHYDQVLDLSEPIAEGTATITNLTVGATNINADSGLSSLQSMSFDTTSNSLARVSLFSGKIGGTTFSNFETLSSLLSTIKEQVDTIWDTVKQFADKTFTVTMKTVKEGGDTPTSTTTTNITENKTKVSVDTSGLDSAAQKLSEIASAAASIPEGKGEIVAELSDAMSEIKPADVPVSKLATAMGNLINKSSAATTIGKIVSALTRVPSGVKPLDIKFRYTTQKASAKGNMPGVANAKGSLAMANGTRTLMGELGPELVVSNGRYFVVGQNGAEFVNLAKDAIVFNHKQTKRLLDQGAIGSRGKPFTNETNAISFARGNIQGPAHALESDLLSGLLAGLNAMTIKNVSVEPNPQIFNLISAAKGTIGGPAKASPKAALAALKEIRSMWQSMLSADAKTLGAMAGRGGSKNGSGGGGGGSGGSSEAFQETNATEEIQRWYNLLRQIARLESNITYEESLQSKLESDRVSNGKAIYESYKRELDNLTEQIAKRKELAALQQSWLNARAEGLKDSKYAVGNIFTYDPKTRLLQYREKFDEKGRREAGFGLDILENLTRRDLNGQAIGENSKTAAAQLKYLQSVGVKLESLIYKDDGTKIANVTDKNGKIHTDNNGNIILYDAASPNKALSGEDLATARTDMVQNFFDLVQGEMDELDSLQDSIIETEKSILEDEEKANAILQKIVDNQLEIEQSVVKAIEDREQKIIDNLQDQKDALQDSADKFFDGLSEQLDREKKMYEQNNKDSELTKLQRQLAILQRSGGSASQIRSLQDQIASKQKDAYFEAQQSQIDAIKEASDKEMERLDAQIDLMTETLEYQKNHGLLWSEVYDVMSKSEDEIKNFIMANGSDWESKSTLQIDEDLRTLSDKIGIYIGNREDPRDLFKESKSSEWNTFVEAFQQYYKDVWEANVDAAQAEHDRILNDTGDPRKASEAAHKILGDELRIYRAERDKAQQTTEVTEQISDLKKDTLKLPTNGSIKKGAKNDNVKILQRALNATNKANLKVDGDFGKKTLEALQNFQSKSGVPVTGKFDQATLEAFKLLKFKTGGLIDYTGPAWVDGTPGKPESILNAEQTAFLRDDFLNGINLFNKTLADLTLMTQSMSDTSRFNGIGNSEPINIENAQVVMNVQQLANDYDAQRAGETALEEMIKIARKSGTRGIVRR